MITNKTSLLSFPVFLTLIWKSEVVAIQKEEAGHKAASADMV